MIERDRPEAIPSHNIALIQRRSELGLRLKDIAQRVEVSIGYISHLENLREFPSRKQALAIAEALETEVEEIFPPYLALFTRPTRQPVWIGVEIPESSVEPEVLNRAYELRAERESSFTVDPEKEAERWELQTILEQFMSDTLAYRKRRTLECLYLYPYYWQDYKKVATEFYTSPAKVRQLEAEALEELRHSPHTNLLEGYLTKPDEEGVRNNQQVGMWLNGAINALHAKDTKRASVNLTNAEAALMKGISPEEQQLISEIKQHFAYRTWEGRWVQGYIKAFMEDHKHLSLSPDRINFSLNRLKEIYCLLEQTKQMK